MGICQCSTFANIKVAFNYLRSDLIKKQRAFKIGLVSIFLVVFFLTMLLNAIQLIPTIFIRLGEQQVGEIDLIFTPYLTSQNIESKKSGFDEFFYNKTNSGSSNASFLPNLNFLNFYDLKTKLENISFIEGVSPRWIITGKTTNQNNNSEVKSKFSTNIFILDSLSENNIGIGRNLNLPELSLNECYISNTLGDALKLNKGDTIGMEIKLSEMLQAFGGRPEQSTPEEREDPEQKIKDRNKNRWIKRNNGMKKKVFYLNNVKQNSQIKTFSQKSKNINITEEQFNIKYKNNNLNSINKALRSIINEFINEQIYSFEEKLPEILKKYIPINIDLKDLSKFSIPKSLLQNNFIINKLPYLKTINQIFFPENNSKNVYNRTNTIINIAKLIFSYDNKTEMISFNPRIINLLNLDNKTRNYKFNLDLSDFLDEQDIQKIMDLIDFKLNLTVKDKVSSTGGKWPSASGNVLAMDSKNIKDYIYLNVERIVDIIVTEFHIEDFKEQIIKYIDPYLKDFDINKYALTVNAIFKDKYETYKKNQKEMRHYISEKANEITKILGLNYPVNIEAPLYTVMSNVEIAQIFLQDIFIGIMFFLWMLSVLLVYSLMLGNVDERTFEFGMLRSLGFKKNNLIIVILLQGLIFAIPGVILGLLTSYIANNYIAFLFNWYTGLVMPFFMNGSNLAFGICIGISIPLISSYFPVKKCLEDNLRETLAIFNKKIGDLVVSIIKLENIGVSPTTLIASITLIIIGLFTYYVAPLSFLLMNPSLFLFIMICILITMLLGLIILTQLLVPFLERFILKIIMFFSFKDRNLHFIVLKNLEGHKRRDQQISIMFMVALGFVIFAGCTLNLVVDFVETMAKSLIGGDFSVFVTNLNSQNLTLNEIMINNYLEATKQNYPEVIKNHAYISWSVEEILDFSTRVGPLSGYPMSNRRVLAIDKNFIDSTYSSLYSVTEYDEDLNVSYTNGKPDIIKMMYDNPNVPYLLEGKNDSFIFPVNPNDMRKKGLDNFQFNIIHAEGIRKSSAIGINNPAKVTLLSEYAEQSIPCKVVGVASKLSGIATYSSYFTLAQISEIYISMEQMKKLIDLETEMTGKSFGNVTNSTVDGVRKRQFILKYKDEVSKKYKEMVFFAINNYLQGLNIFSIQLDDVIEMSENVKNIMSYIFLVLGIIALILSFFLIWTSFYSNIRENIAEYGIMRSIGVTKSQSTRIYLYEAATIIITSIIIGTFIGIVISSTLILQFDVFVELPFIFNFPYKLYFILIIVGLILGLLGSYYPTYAVNTLSLVKIMKGFNE